MNQKDSIEVTPSPELRGFFMATLSLLLCLCISMVLIAMSMLSIEKDCSVNTIILTDIRNRIKENEPMETIESDETIDIEQLPSLLDTATYKSRVEPDNL